MAFFVIAEPCGGCKDRGCVEVCPCDVIHEGAVAWEGKTINQLFINPMECIDCGACEPVCPVNAIFPDDELPEKWRHYREINARFYSGDNH